MSCQGHNPLRWDCEQRGCFNKLKRPKIECFADLWPGRASMGDVDGIVEIAGQVLMLEWKSHTDAIPRGQQLMYERITRGCAPAVVCVAGDAERMTVQAHKVFWQGAESPWIASDMDSLRARMSKWRRWAQSATRGY